MKRISIFESRRLGLSKMKEELISSNQHKLDQILSISFGYSRYVECSESAKLVRVSSSIQFGLFPIESSHLIVSTLRRLGSLVTLRVFAVI